MKQPARYYLFPRDAYFVPSVRRLVDLIGVMDREMDLGLEGGDSFQAFVRERAPEEDAEAEEASEQVLDATSFADFRVRSETLSGDLKEIDVHLGRPGREPLRSHELGTRDIEVLGYPSLRMVEMGGLMEVGLQCPSCGQQSGLDGSFSERPDPRFYCGQCGGLTPLPDTRFTIGGANEGILSPCYRFVIRFDAEAEPSAETAVSAPTPGVVGIEALEGSLGCGLRAVLVRSPLRTEP